MPRAETAQGEEITQRDLIAEGFAIERFGAGGEDEEEAARAERGKQRVEELAREEAAVGIRGGIAEFVEREFVQLGQEAEHDGHQADEGGAPPRHVVTAHAHHDDNQHADEEHQGQGGIDGGGDFIFGTQALVIAGPLFGDLEVLAVAAGLIAEDSDFQAVGGVVQLEIALLPGEGAVDAMGAGDVGGLHEVQRGRVAGEASAEEVFGQGARLRGSGGGAGSVFRQHMLEARKLAGRCDFDVVLFLLQGPEPAIGPAPETNP